MLKKIILKCVFKLIFAFEIKYKTFSFYLVTNKNADFNPKYVV